MKNLLFVATLACFLWSCSESKDNDKIKQIKVDVFESPDMEQTKKFQDRFNISLMQLETTEESILASDRPYIVTSKEDIFLLDNSQDLIFRFNRDGKFINKIGRVGNGPQEYLSTFDIAILDNSIYVLDRVRIQQYDFDGNHIKSIPVLEYSRQLVVTKEGNLAVSGGVKCGYGLTIYNSSGEKIASHLPYDKSFKEGNFNRSAINSLIRYGDNFCVTNYLDYNIYMMAGNKIDTLLSIDLGQYSVPNEMFNSDPAQKMTMFEKFRSDFVMSINYLFVNDDWIIFTPSIGRDSRVTYYNRKDNSVISNKGFTLPYSAFFGKNLPPLHYDSQDKVYYSSIGSFELKEMLEELSEIDPNYQITYPFLKGLEADKIDEESNGWLIKWSIGD